ncbi:MAG: hypothetical protein GY751_04515, partial [Bacteroidetes bacterium]|nr:hypothetical protein [Bacteroidota bacterium]
MIKFILLVTYLYAIMFSQALSQENQLDFLKNTLAKTIINIPSYSLFEFQYQRFAQQEPLVHKALYAAATGSSVGVQNAIRLIRQRENVRAVAKFLPDLSASLSLAKVEASVPLGTFGSAKVGVTFGPSIEARLRTGDAVLGYYEESTNEKDRQRSFAILSNPGEIRIVASLLASIDLANTGAKINGMPEHFVSNPLYESRDKIIQSFDRFPHFDADIDEQLKRLSSEEATIFK